MLLTSPRLPLDSRGEASADRLVGGFDRGPPLNPALVSLALPGTSARLIVPSATSIVAWYLLLSLILLTWRRVDQLMMVEGTIAANGTLLLRQRALSCQWMLHQAPVVEWWASSADEAPTPSVRHVSENLAIDESVIFCTAS